MEPFFVPDFTFGLSELLAVLTVVAIVIGLTAGDGLLIIFYVSLPMIWAGSRELHAHFF